MPTAPDTLHALALAMLDAQIAATEAGRPDAAAREVGALARLARDPAALQQALSRGGVREGLEVPVVLQSTRFTCGPAALSAALAAHDIDRDEATLAQALGTHPERGTCPGALVDYVRSLGLPCAEGDHLDLGDLQQATQRGAPVLACCQGHGGGHWVLIVDANPTGVTFLDPATGPNRVTAEEWAERWFDTDADGKRWERYGLAIGPPPAGVREGLLEARLLEGAPAGYTGEWPDKNGHRRCYQQGHEVKCPKKDMNTERVASNNPAAATNEPEHDSSEDDAHFQAWQARDEARQERRELIDAATWSIESAATLRDQRSAWREAHDALLNEGPVAVQRAIDAFSDVLNTIKDEYADIGEVMKELDPFSTSGRLAWAWAKNVEKAVAAASRKLDAYGAAVEAWNEALLAVEASEAEEPDEAPDDPEYPPEPEEPDPDDFEDDEELEAEQEEWDRAHEQWEEECERIGERHEKLEEQTTEAYAEWEAANDELQQEADEAAEEVSALADALDEALDGAQELPDDLGLQHRLGEILQALDEEDEADPEPDEDDEEVREGLQEGHSGESGVFVDASGRHYRLESGKRVPLGPEAAGAAQPAAQPPAATVVVLGVPPIDGSAHDAPHLPQSVPVEFANDDARDAVASVFGRDVPPELLAAAANGLDSTSTTVMATGGKLRTTTAADGYFAKRTFSRSPSGELECHNDTFENQRFKGAGVNIFLNQVRALREAGVSHISTLAGGSLDEAAASGFNGYITWPKFGYDGDIDSTQFAALPRAYQQAMGDRRNLQSLMALPGGAEAWELHGSRIVLKFDLADNSPSMKALDAYLEKRRGQAPGEREPRPSGTPAERAAATRARLQGKIDAAAKGLAAAAPRRGWLGRAFGR